MINLLLSSIIVLMFYGEHWRKSYLATITNYYRRHGFEFDCNQEATHVRGAKPLIDFN